MLRKTPELIVPFINESFGRSYPLDAEIVQFTNEHETPHGSIVDDSVFSRYLVPLYKQASYKPYIIAAMIFLAKVKDPAKALEELEAKGKERKAY